MGLFDSGISGLVAAQRGLATTGHNISNANTPGYSRQRVELEARPAHGTRTGFIGNGVGVASVRRITEDFASADVRVSNAAATELSTYHQLMSQVDSLLADADGGLAPALGGFFDAMQDLAADPASVPARELLIAGSEGLVQRFHTLDRRLGDMERSIEHRMSAQVTEINGLASSLADVNARIMTAEGAGLRQPANDLRDQRDELLRELSGHVSVSTVTQTDGSLNVYVGSGQSLVVGSVALSLSVVANGFDPTRADIAIGVGSATSTITEQLSGGELGGLLRFREDGVDGVRNSLGVVAAGIARTVNDQHRLGQDTNGIAGGDFFNALDVNAPEILAHATNTGAPEAAFDVRIADTGKLTDADYRLERVGALYTLTNLDDGTATTLAGFPAAPVFVDGVRIEVTGGTIADGDAFLLRPTARAAADIALALNHPNDIAAASAVRAASALANVGTAEITQPSVNGPDHALTYTFTSPTTFDVRDETTGTDLATGLTFAAGGPVQFNGVTVAISGGPSTGDTFTVVGTISQADAANAGTGTIAEPALAARDPVLTDPVTITFTSATTFDVTGSSTGFPVVGRTYTSGETLSFNGWTTQITGIAQTGDTFTIGPNTAGVGDNRNALELASMQTEDRLVDRSATYEEMFGRTVARVGTATRQAEIGANAQGALLVQATDVRDSVSAVNLDEEAANLLRYQQAYQASARVISIVDEAFDTLLAAVG